MNARELDITDLIAFVFARRPRPDGLLFWLAHLVVPTGVAGVRHAWNECPNAEWLLWLAEGLGVPVALQVEAKERAERARMHGPLTLKKGAHVEFVSPNLDATTAVRAVICAERIPGVLAVSTTVRALGDLLPVAGGARA